MVGADASDASASLNANLRNTIMFGASDGIRVTEAATGTTIGNALRGNQLISTNATSSAGLGLNLGTDGVDLTNAANSQVISVMAEGNGTAGGALDGDGIRIGTGGLISG
jgi:hypothetical protein